MTSEKYEKTFRLDLEKMTLRSSIRNILESGATEYEIERWFYASLAESLKAVRHSTCSTCYTPLCSDDWDLLGNLTDECEHCHYEQKIKRNRFSEIGDYK